MFRRQHIVGKFSIAEAIALGFHVDLDVRPLRGTKEHQGTEMWIRVYTEYELLLLVDEALEMRRRDRL